MTQPGKSLHEEIWDSDLFALVNEAVRAAGELADTHLAGGGYRPRISMPSVDAFDSGWPNLSDDRLFPSENSPTDHSALFGAERGHLKPFAFSDVPELQAVLSYVNAKPDLRERLSMSLATDREDLVQRMIDHEVFDLPLSILDRCRATGATDEESLRRIYVERENAWFVAQLPVEYVFPLALTALDLDEALALDENTRIEPLDTPTQAARAPSLRSMGSVPPMVVSAATHAIVVGPSTLPNPGPGPRIFGPDTEDVPLSIADSVCQVLRIISHVDVGYAQVLRRPLGWADRWHHDLPALTGLATLRRYPDRFDNYQWLRQPNPITRQALTEAPAVFQALGSAPANIKLAARRLTALGLRGNDEDKVIDACIGLEALLGEGRDELTHRLSLRAATVLATRAHDPGDPTSVYRLTKKVYTHRSAVVHGTSATKTRNISWGDTTISAAAVAEILLRDVLTDALTREPRWTPASLDAELLSSLRPTDAEQRLDDGDAAPGTR